ncbi:hypothetical protein ACLD7X_015060, partial [Aphanothece microscopica RSMan92]
AVEEIVSSGPDRIIVYEGAEEKLKQLGTGLLEKLGIGGPSWEQEERERYRSTMVPVENQLAPGVPSVQEQRRIQPASSQAFVPEEELDYVEVEERRERAPLRQRRYLDEEEGLDDRRFEAPPRYPDGRYSDSRYPEGRYEESNSDEGRYGGSRFEGSSSQGGRSGEGRYEDGGYRERRLPGDRPGEREASPRELRPIDGPRRRPPGRLPAEPVDVDAEELDDPW